MSLTIQWLSHASFKISNDVIIYIDPWKLETADHDADVVLISHGHYDHFSADDLAKVSGPATQVITTPDVADQLEKASIITPGQTIELPHLKITGVAAYNPAKQFHPQANNWLGFIVEINGKRIYYAGDTDLIAEMGSLGEIDLALLPVGGTYTIDPAEAAGAIKKIAPRRSLPYHWGDIVGTADDAQRFADLADCDVTILQPGETSTL